MFAQLTILCVILFAGVYGQNATVDLAYYCQRLQTIDCSHFNSTPMCGTNKVTYLNRCEIGKAHCADQDVHYWHGGPCDGDAQATRSPQEVQHGSEIILNFECMYLGHIPCTPPKVDEKVCANDGKTYQNFCEYEKSRCMHKYLHVVHLGDC